MEEAGARRQLRDGLLARGELHGAGAAAVDELEVGELPYGVHDAAAAQDELAGGQGLHEPDEAGAGGVRGRGVADAGDLRLVRQQPHQPEAGPLGDVGGQVGGLVRLADGGAQGTHPAAEGDVGGVEVEAEPQLGARVHRGHGGFQVVEVGGRVDGHGDLRGGARVRRQGGQRLPVGRGVGHEDVGDAAGRQPERLGERVRHDAAEAVHGQDVFEQGAAADGLAGDPDRLARGPAYEVCRVGPHGGEVDDRERWFQGRCGAVVALAVIHTGSVTA
ncbi:hypothetical protein GCM10020220_096540 [Nonomuraea rubra]